MSSWTSWYTSQFRTRRLPNSPYLPRTDTTGQRAQAAMAAPNDPNSILMNLADLQLAGSENANAVAKKKSDTLFGPDIGIVSGGPAWTEALRGKNLPADELTVDVVKGWIEKSRKASQPTTTLQALVNLKRPTLRLSPLKASEDDESSQLQHALEFEYDCDAPKCGILVHVVLSPEHPEAQSKDAPSPMSVFETTTEGGFGRKLGLDDGAMLELGRYEPNSAPAPSAQETAPAAAPSAPPAEGTASVPVRPPAGGPDRRSKRFSFHLRRRANRAVAGPALAVVDAEAAAPTTEEGIAKDAASTKENEDDLGVKVTIRLAALDEDGKELTSPNEQVTYLHVVRFGAPPVVVEGTDTEEDTRPWVVKVVKREAVIGPHVFHLHEIYGLSAHSTQPTAPTAPTPASYPPTTAPPAQEDEPSSECLLCLSAPREVVLLPCRHLVACKECALNMIEFGAGGTIQQNEDAPAETPGAAGAAGDAPDAAANTEQENAAATAAAAAAPTPAPRRKRKAKGWFCPVCRQPYTSMLRITTIPPTEEEPPVAKSEANEAPAPAEENAGPLGGFGRPGFLRGLSLGSRNTAAASAPADVERGGA